LLTEDGAFDVAALDLELEATIKLIESGSELVVMGRQQILGHRVLIGRIVPKGCGTTGTSAAVASRIS
jgi:hypothetical protein